MAARKTANFGDAQARVHEYAAEVSFLHLVALAKVDGDGPTKEKLFREALSLIKIGHYDATPELLYATGECHFGLRNYTTALDVLSRGFQLGWQLPNLIELRGRCLFQLGEYKRAMASFLEVADMGSNTRENLTWVMRCQARDTTERDTMSRLIEIDAPVMSLDVRHDWYQTKTHVNLIVYAVGLTEDQFKVTYTERSVEIAIDQNGATKKMQLELEHEIDPKCCDVTIGQVKVEVRMAKSVQGMWKLW